MTSIDTALAIRNGDVQRYDAEYKNAIQSILAGEKYVEDIDTVTDFLHPLGIKADENDRDFWVNKRIAEYYGIDIFYLKEDDSTTADKPVE